MHPVPHLACQALRSNLFDLPAPYKLTFAVTYRCNSRCTTCGIWKRERTPELSLDRIERFFRANPSLAWIDLTGGEVFLRDDFPAIAEAAVRHLPGLYLLHFPTNGLLPERIEEGVRRILEAKPHRLIVSVSVDGPEPVHDRLRGGEGFYRKAVETLRRLRALRSRRFRVYPGMTVSAENLGHIDATVAALAEALPGFDARDLHVNLAQVSPHFYGNAEMDTSFHPRALEEIRRFAARKGRALDGVHALERAYLKLAERFVRVGRTPLPCMALAASCFVDPDGSIRPCSVEGEVVASLEEMDDSLARAWRDPVVYAARERIREGRCCQCWTPCEAYQTLFAHLGTVARCNLT